MVITDKRPGEENWELRDLHFSINGCITVTEMETVRGKHGGGVRAVSRGRENSCPFSVMYTNKLMPPEQTDWILKP